MRIGAFPLWTGSQIGGIATYDTELLPALAGIAPEHEFHIYSPSREAIQRLGMQRANVHHHLLFPRSRWINVPISFPIAAAFARLDLLHMTHVPPPISPKPYVMTLHCFSPFTHPEFYPKALGMRMNALVKRGIQAARVLICVSNGVKEMAQADLKISPDRLAVAYNGVSDRFQPMPSARMRVEERHGIDRPYLLFVGVIAPRKNLVRVVEAYDLYRQQMRSDALLVVVGRRWLADDVDHAVRRLGLEGSVIFLNHVDDSHLPDLYSAAEMLVFPSLWESFGIPAMECMACGTPVLTSRGSCMPEIVGDAAVLVDPYSVEAIAEGIAKIMNDPGLADDLRRKGLERAKGFTWRDSARQTLAAYHQALAG